MDGTSDRVTRAGRDPNALGRRREALDRNFIPLPHIARIAASMNARAHLRSSCSSFMHAVPLSPGAGSNVDMEA